MSYDRIETALRFLDGHRERQPTLDETARHVGLSPFHFQRLFTRWAGVSPKRFLRFLTVEEARIALDRSRSVLDATFDAGLSSPGRLHDLLVTVDAVTPGEYRSRGAGLTIRYGVQESPFGTCLVGATGRGVCWLSFHDDASADDGVTALRTGWSGADLVPDDADAARWRDRIFSGHEGSGEGPLPVLVRGTNFQLKVWEALIRVTPGELCGYRDVARWIGRPTAARAVGSAVAVNPVTFLIPCHRVIRSMGSFGDYRWGITRKKAMIGWERSRRDGAM